MVEGGAIGGGMSALYVHACELLELYKRIQAPIQLTLFCMKKHISQEQTGIGDKLIQMATLPECINSILYAYP
jgi:hypothetical protein